LKEDPPVVGPGSACLVGALTQTRGGTITKKKENKKSRGGERSRWVTVSPLNRRTFRHDLKEEKETRGREHSLMGIKGECGWSVTNGEVGKAEAAVRRVDQGTVSQSKKSQQI